MQSPSPTTTVPPQTDRRSAVTVLAGFSPAATEAVARILLVADPELALIQHDISAVHAGVVRRTVRTATQVLENEVVELAHGCVSCTLREDVLPTLVRTGRRRPGGALLLTLPPAIEPEAVAAACAGCAVDGAPVTDTVRFDSYVTVVEAAAILADLASTDDLRHRDLHAADNDHRGVADVAISQIEYADTIVTWGSPDHDPLDAARLKVLLSHLAPWAVQLRIGDTSRLDCTAIAARLRSTGRHNPRTPGMAARALEGFPIGIHQPRDDHGVGSVLFTSRRPFHPQRLHDALDDLSGEALRGRGQFWLASQPDTALGLEAAGGGVGMGPLGHWLAALPTDRWTEAGDYRRMTADLNWDPYYGDRHTALAFIGLHLDADALTGRLTDCLLTDAELADGFDAWRLAPDPFADCFPMPEDD
jgi:G3E family GTPase